MIPDSLNTKCQNAGDTAQCVLLVMRIVFAVCTLDTSFAHDAHTHTVCIHTHTHSNTHTHTHTHTHTQTLQHTHTQAHTHTVTHSNTHTEYMVTNIVDPSLCLLTTSSYLTARAKCWYFQYKCMASFYQFLQ